MSQLLITVQKNQRWHTCMLQLSSPLRSKFQGHEVTNPDAKWKCWAKCITIPYMKPYMPKKKLTKSKMTQIILIQAHKKYPINTIYKHWQRYNPSIKWHYSNHNPFGQLPKFHDCWYIDKKPGNFYSFCIFSTPSYILQHLTLRFQRGAN